MNLAGLKFFTHLFGISMKKLLVPCFTLAMCAFTQTVYAACPSNSISQNTSLVKNNKALTLVNGKLILKNGSARLLRDALQLATDVGRKITIEGTYFISRDAPVILKRKVDVTATNATFKATKSLDGDMISFNTAASSFDCPKDPSFTWLGGRFEIWNAKTSTVVPGTQSANKGDSQEGLASTADALSIRGDSEPRGQSVRRRHLGDVDIRRITVIGTEDSSEDYRFAGGDSGILMIAAKSAYIRNNKFYGIRDAAVYLSSDNTNGNLGDNYRLIDNYAERVFDGFTSKRGADNIEFKDNKVVDAVIAISTKSTNYNDDKWNARNVRVLNNEVIRAMRAISLERTDDIQIRDNQIKQLGGIVAGETVNRANLSSLSNAFEGISLNGVNGTYSISNNTIRGLNASTRQVHAMVLRTFDGKRTRNIVQSSSQTNKWTGVDQVNNSKIIVGKAFDR